MALDIIDDLVNNDIVFANTDKYRAYNLFANQAVFVDNPAISLNLSDMVSAGLNDNQIEDIILNYLSSFDVDLKDTSIKVDRGNVEFLLDFGGSYVQP